MAFLCQLLNNRFKGDLLNKILFNHHSNSKNLNHCNKHSNKISLKARRSLFKSMNTMP